MHYKNVADNLRVGIKSRMGSISLSSTPSNMNENKWSKTKFFKSKTLLWKIKSSTMLKEFMRKRNKRFYCMATHLRVMHFENE